MRRFAPFTIAAALLLAALSTTASARVVFEVTPYALSQFRNLNESLASCGSSQESFLCTYEDGEFFRVPTKGADFFFTPAGELAAAFTKFQRGQTLNNYNLNDRVNLVPFASEVPAGGILLDGAYHTPENVDGDFRMLDENTLLGEFEYTIPGFRVERRVIVSAVSESAEHYVTLTPIAAADTESSAAPTLVQFAVPGIANIASPVVKIGFESTFVTNPAERAYQAPMYASLQKNDNNRDQAFVMLPLDGTSSTLAGNGVSLRHATGDAVSATFLRPNLIAMQTALGAGSTSLGIRLYAGNNELVRYSQEGFLDLPGLFRPNILGRLSLAIVQVLEFIHQYVPSWGLSIIVLTLLFRALVWPLITTQTKSMFGMQALQPKIQEIQRKYKDDREKLTQETMKLYREAGVNPAGGCLPILVQMPLFIILWRVFVNFEFAEGFLWLPDLGQADPIFILPILYIGVMVAMSWFSARNNPTMLRQSMIMNLVFGFIIFAFPAGVLLYYVVSMAVQVFQYWLISRNQPKVAPLVPAAAGKRGK
ncbi:MAG: membrane protein insertase YidC [Trueperaceae bacterium]|nr:membrane protein insertase YidC [Trueperaceae bacterium]